MFPRYPVLDDNPGAGGAGAPPPAEPPPSEPAPPAAGGEPPPAGSKGAAAPPATGGEPPASSGDAPPAGDDDSSSGEDWRDQAARGDAALRKRLDRFGSMADVVDSFRALEKKLSGKVADLLKPPPETEGEELAKWREARGIPAEPGDYEKALGELVLGDDDKPVVEAFFAAAHAGNLPADAVKTAMDWYASTAELMQEQREKFVAEAKAASEKALKDEWGIDYKANLASIGNLLELAGDRVKAVFEGGYTADGVPLLAHVDTARFLRQMAGEMGAHEGTQLGGGNTDKLADVDSRLAELNTFMRTNSKEWYRNEALQKEFLELTERKAKLQAR